jgi:hypothetical protein
MFTSTLSDEAARVREGPSHVIAESNAYVPGDRPRSHVDQRRLADRTTELAGLEILLVAARVHAVPALRTDEQWLRLHSNNAIMYNIMQKCSIEGTHPPIQQCR